MTKPTYFQDAHCPEPLCRTSGKICHPTKSAAKKHLKRVKGLGGERAPVETYECCWCKMWHVGHARHKHVGSTRYNRQSGEVS